MGIKKKKKKSKLNAETLRHGKREMEVIHKQNLVNKNIKSKEEGKEKVKDVQMRCIWYINVGSTNKMLKNIRS